MTITEYPDGRREMTYTTQDETETFNINGKSVRQIKRLIPVPVPQLDDMVSSEVAADYQVIYRYEYRFDVYDITGSFVDTIVVSTYADMVDMIPAAFVMAGLDEPCQEDLDDMAADLLLYWVDPAVDWANYN